MKSLKELYAEHSGKVSDKWSLYLDAYDEIFTPFRDKPLNLLEIGVQNGGSLELWAKYFTRAKRLVGCDINPGCAELRFDDPRIALVVGDANGDKGVRAISKHAADYDLIIDDGSHTSSDIVRSFALYFPLLNENGLFVVEDLHCSYWEEFQGGLYDPYSSISFFKRLSDVVNFAHWGNQATRQSLLTGFEERYGEGFDEEMLSSIHSVSFLNSLCIVRKRAPACNELGVRVVAGSNAAVNAEPLTFHGHKLLPADQSANPWSALKRPPDELWQAQVERATDAESRNSTLEALNEQRARRIEQLELLAQEELEDIETLQKRNDELEVANEHHLARIAQLEASLGEVWSSTSWQVTAPLRALGSKTTSTRRLRQGTRLLAERSGLIDAVRKAYGVTRIAGPVVRSQGGVRPAARKLWSVVSREGIDGIRTRVRQHYARASLLLPNTADISFLNSPGKPASDLLRRRVLIVAELSIPQCTKYRVTQKVEMLAELGIVASVVSWTDHVECLSLMSTHSEVIFYRTPGFPLVLDLIAEARRLGLTSYWEVDDVIFDRALLENSRALKALDRHVYQQLLEGAGLYLRAMQACDKGIASTTALREAMRQRTGKTTFVIENALDSATIKRVEAINSVTRTSDGTVRIVYGSGTNTHNVDFEEAAGALLTVLDRYPQARFRLIGTLDLPAEFQRFEDRIERIPFCSYDEYLGYLAECDINIAPLEKSLFTDAKSNIKYLEAAALKLPSVCSAAQSFSDAIEPGIRGYLCETEVQWLQSLCELIDDPQLRARMGQAAHDHVMEHYSPSNVAREQVAGIFEPVSNRTRPRVLSVNVYYSPRSFGGATIVAEEMNRWLSTDRYDVYVFTTLPDGVAAPYGVRRYDVDNVSIFGCSVPGALSPAEQFENPAVEHAFSQVLSAVDPDIVHFHSIQGIGILPLELCRQRGIPYVVTAHDAWWICGRQFMIDRHQKYCGQKVIDLSVCASCVDNPALNTYRTETLRRNLDSASAILMPSQYFADLHLANGFSPARVVLNKNGIRRPDKRQKLRESPVIRFAYVGGNTEIKGVHLVRSVFRAPLPDHAKLLVVDNTLNLGFSAFSDGYFSGCKNVEIVPAYNSETIDDFFAGVDVLLFPTQWKESFGLTVREALARNVWVIATDGGAVAEDIIDGVNGYIVPFGDDGTEMQGAIQRAIDYFSKIDIGERIELANGHIRYFDEQAEELASIYDESIETHRAHPVWMQAD